MTSVFTAASPPPLRVDIDEAVGFLVAWAPSPWALFAITEMPTGEKRVVASIAADEADAAEFVGSYAGRGWNLYFSMNRPSPSVRTTPRKDEIVELVGLHVDVDLPKPPSPYAAPTPENIDRLLEVLRTVSPPPTGVVFSGGGFQAIWNFPAPIPATQENVLRVEAANRALEGALAADNCHNVNRLLRLPGTINVPDARKRARGRVPARAYVVSYDASLSWELGRDHVPAPRAQRDPSDELPLDDDVESGRSIGELSARLQRLIRTGDASDWGNDRSRLVWYVVTNLVRLRWTKEEVLAVLLNQTLGLYAHLSSQSDPRSYAARQVERATAAVRSDWERHRLTNQILHSSQSNVRRALDEIGAKFSFNTFAIRAYVNGAGPLRPIDDDSTINLRLTIDERFGFLPDKDLFSDVIRNLCRQGDYHPVRDYLDSLEWDGIPRLGRPSPHDLAEAEDDRNVPLEPDGGSPGWLTTYGGAEDSAYTRMVGRLILIAAVRRVRDPGCKFDEMLVLINPIQGTDKSTAVQILAKDIAWFADSLPLGASPKQVIEQLSGKWIVEASELNGMRKSDVEHLKTFMAQRYDSDRLAYDRYRTELPRQCVFIGTTNSTVFLKDDQNRRFWPVMVDRFDTAALARDVDKLWAEAARAEADRESIRLPRALWAVAAERQAEARSSEPWAETIGDVLGDLPGRIVNADVWKILNKPSFNRTQDDNRRIGETMRELGFERRRLRVDGQVRIVYVRGTPLEQRAVIYVFRDEITGTVTANHDPADSAVLDVIHANADFPGRPEP